MSMNSDSSVSTAGALVLKLIALDSGTSVLAENGIIVLIGCTGANSRAEVVAL